MSFLSAVPAFAHAATSALGGGQQQQHSQGDAAQHPGAAHDTPHQSVLGSVLGGISSVALPVAKQLLGNKINGKLDGATIGKADDAAQGEINKALKNACLPGAQNDLNRGTSTKEVIAGYRLAKDMSSEQQELASNAKKPDPLFAAKMAGTTLDEAKQMGKITQAELEKSQFQQQQANCEPEQNPIPVPRSLPSPIPKTSPQPRPSPPSPIPGVHLGPGGVQIGVGEGGGNKAPQLGPQIEPPQIPTTAPPKTPTTTSDGPPGGLVA